MRGLTREDFRRMDDLHLQVRRETNLQRQIALVDQIAGILGYPRVDPMGNWAKVLVQFICAGTDEESSWAGSLQGKKEREVRNPGEPPDESVMVDAIPRSEPRTLN